MKTIIDNTSLKSKEDILLKWLLLAALLFINGVVLFNAIYHDPRIGYDSYAHLDYVKHFAQFKLVTKKESREFFSPPMPYAFPSLLMGVFKFELHEAAKYAQYLNVLLSVGLTCFLLKICKLFPSRRYLAVGSLVLLGMLPVYYKTFSFVRGEPFVAFWVVVAVYYALRIFMEGQHTGRNVASLGIAIGLAVLSRQWGIMLVPAIALMAAVKFVLNKDSRKLLFKSLSISLLIAFTISGWFYIALKINYGSFTAFNRGPNATFSIKNQPKSFYCDVSPALLFNSPVRPNFPNQLIPIFYSDIWGDYWCYFLVSGKNLRNPTGLRVEGMSLMAWKVHKEKPKSVSTNYHDMAGYLGRVNLVSLLPTLLFVLAFLWAVFSLKPFNRDINDGKNKSNTVLFLLISIIILSLGSYLWFLIQYPELEKGDTIKATYQLHVFPLFALIGGFFLQSVAEKSRRIFYLIIVGLLLVLTHNIMAMVTHYPMFRVFWDY